MPGLSSAGEAAVLAAIDANAFVSLHTADPGDTGANEVAGNGYARQGPVAFVNSGNNPTVAANTAIVSFPTATNPWGSVTNFGVWTDAATGTFLGGGLLDAPKPVAAGDQVRFLTGALTLTAD